MDMSQFSVEYDRWREEAFPPGSEVDDLDEAHSRLAYVDAMVADAAIGFVKGGVPPGTLPRQVRADLADVFSTVEAYEGQGKQPLADIVASYRRYAERLAVMLAYLEEIDLGVCRTDR
jgi:hypothetical protein